mmetsp:Transcript_382/g.1079  ORF Transcript_382/g.1079 Transcript_382/m.1079 type:complete len:298 (-) Transcript_382:568-1461(-)
MDDRWTGVKYTSSLKEGCSVLLFLASALRLLARSRRGVGPVVEGRRGSIAIRVIHEVGAHRRGDGVHRQHLLRVRHRRLARQHNRLLVLEPERQPLLLALHHAVSQLLEIAKRLSVEAVHRRVDNVLVAEARGTRENMREDHQLLILRIRHPVQKSVEQLHRSLVVVLLPILALQVRNGRDGEHEPGDNEVARPTRHRHVSARVRRHDAASAPQCDVDSAFGALLAAATTLACRCFLFVSAEKKLKLRSFANHLLADEVRERNALAASERNRAVVGNFNSVEFKKHGGAAADVHRWG